jgi:site-specific recombinase XerD
VAQKAQKTKNADDLGSVRRLATSFELSLRAANKAPRTISTYLFGVERFARFLETTGMPTAVTAVHREHVEAWVADELERTSATTAAIRYRSLQQFFRWCVSDGEINVSPMVNMSPPKVPEQPVPVISTEDMTKLLKACGGSDFASRRDLAIIRLFAATGIRRSEMAGLKCDDIDLRTRTLVVLGKGRRERQVRFDHKAAQALDRYIRVRARHRLASESWLWLGLAGRLTDNGLASIVRKRAAAAGIEGRVNLHRFRHSFSHQWLAAGGQGEDLMMLNGWKSRTMLSRYGSSAAVERALAAYDRIAPGEDL